jgi:hypothetical protein
MTISDALVRGLHARLSAESDADFDEAARQLLTAAKTENIDGFGELVYAAFKLAALRRWPVSWTSPEIVRFIADIRSDTDEAAQYLSPSAAENQIRLALGDTVTPWPDMEARGRAQFTLLCILTADYASDELDNLLAEARALANEHLTTNSG